MIEEIKIDNNCIVKAFENNPISILEEDINNKRVYYFKASDIGKALNLTNIAVSIQHYDEDERVIRKAYDTTRREQSTLFLTSRGVYRLLYNSKKELAKKFRKWASDILDDIIFNESTELKRQLENKDKLLLEKEDELKLKENDLEAQKLLIKKKDKELKLMSKKISLDWLYVAVTDNISGVSKIGISEEILRRIDGHLSSNPGFKYVFTYQSKNNKVIEKCIKAILDPFLTNKNEWFNIEPNDLVYLVKFFIELFDKNNGSEDPKLIIDFIKNISKKELNQEYISNELYDDFFKKNIEEPAPLTDNAIDNAADNAVDNAVDNGHENYKCTLISIQKELEKYLNEHNFNKQIKKVKYLDVYTLDIKRYIKYRYNKTCERINIDDAKSNIHIASTYGYSGFRMKNLYIDKFFENDVYTPFMDQYILVDNESKSSLSEILVVFNKYLEKNNIDDKLVKQNKYFKTSFREEFLKEIENFYGINSIKKINTGKKNGYYFFTGIKIKV
jgi:prophage antirepressor-like protein